MKNPSPIWGEGGARSRSEREGEGTAAGILQHLFYFFAAAGLMAGLAVTAFAISFAIEESYPRWPQQPGMRSMPSWILWLTLVEIGFLVVSIGWARIRHWAALLALAMMLVLWGAFLLITNDIIS